MAQHPLDPMGAAMLAGDQEAVEIQILHQRQISAVPVEAVQPEKQIPGEGPIRSSARRRAVSERWIGGIETLKHWHTHANARGPADVDFVDGFDGAVRRNGL